jgi:TonB family protein
MRRRDPIILIALLTALGLHLAILSVGVRAARRNLGWWLESPAQARMTPPPKPQDAMQQLGEHESNGLSINRAPGPRPMESAVSDARQEQAAMQRDPEGFEGQGSNQPLEQALRGDNGDGRPQGQNSGGASAAAVFGSRETALAEKTPRLASPLPPAMDPLSRGPMPVKPRKAVAEAAEPTVTGVPANEQQKAASASGGAGGKPGSAQQGSGKPMPTSDFESYPVSHIVSRFVAGQIEARTGRKMKARELPRLGLAAIADLQQMQSPYVVLMLKIDALGNVTDVKVTHSSGSDNVDLPCVRAAYTWWFEPMKDPLTGTVHGELIEFTIYF